MGRSALLFLVIGLAIGLWLGFNPAAHRDVVHWWNRTSASQVDGKSHAALTIRQLNSGLTRSLRTSPRPLGQPGAEKNTVPTWNQILGELHAFWLALERIWLSIIGKVRT